MRWIWIFSFLISGPAWASEEKPLWEYGAGFGYVRFEHYPASNQYSHIALPFPTFQYRGEILRADDREGGRAYLFKKSAWSIEMSGGGFTPLDSRENRARQGMADLPFVLELGPQLVYDPDDANWEVKFSFFQANSILGSFVKYNGGVLKSHYVYHWRRDEHDGRLSLSAEVASQELSATYFEVSSAEATNERRAYDAKGGLMSMDLSYFHRYAMGKLSLYAGTTLSFYSVSVNRESPLHKSDVNVGYLVGLTYVLGESERKSVPENQTRGLINVYRDKFRSNMQPFE